MELNITHTLFDTPSARGCIAEAVAEQAIHGCDDRDAAAVRVQAEIAGMREAIDILQDFMELLYSNAAESPEWVRERINRATDAAARAMRVTDAGGGQ